MGCRFESIAERITPRHQYGQKRANNRIGGQYEKQNQNGIEKTGPPVRLRIVREIHEARFIG
jgi:hypothetical protein